MSFLKSSWRGGTEWGKSHRKGLGVGCGRLVAAREDRVGIPRRWREDGCQPLAHQGSSFGLRLDKHEAISSEDRPALLLFPADAAHSLAGPPLLLWERGKKRWSVKAAIGAGRRAAFRLHWITRLLSG